MNYTKLTFKSIAEFTRKYGKCSGANAEKQTENQISTEEVRRWLSWRGSRRQEEGVHPTIPELGM